MCEFITAGGLVGQDLPQQLQREGALMRDSLLRDLTDLGYVVQTTHDARLQLGIDAASKPVSQDEDAWQIWTALAKNCDAAWLIAPESDGILFRLTQTVGLQGTPILGCGADMVKTCSSKMATFLALSAAGIPCVPTFDVGNWPRTPNTPYLAKPDDGAGCEQTVVFNRVDDLERWLKENQAEKTHIIQPYVEGISASLSCIMHKGRGLLLSVNQQKVQRENADLLFKGVTVNALADYWPKAEKLAAQIAEAMPDLNGYVGVDVMLQGGEFQVLEINPRLTTSYAGLRESIGQNPAELVLSMLRNPEFRPKGLSRKRVDIDV